MKNVMEEIIRLQALTDNTDYMLTYYFTSEGTVWRVDIAFDGGSLLASIWPALDCENERVSLYPGKMNEEESTETFSPVLLNLIVDILLTFAKEIRTP